MPRLACQWLRWRQLAGQLVECLPWVKGHCRDEAKSAVSVRSGAPGEEASGPPLDGGQNLGRRVIWSTPSPSASRGTGSRTAVHEMCVWRLAEGERSDCAQAPATADVWSAVVRGPTTCWRYESRPDTYWPVSGSEEESKGEEEAVSLVYTYQPGQFGKSTKGSRKSNIKKKARKERRVGIYMYRLNPGSSVAGPSRGLALEAARGSIAVDYMDGWHWPVSTQYKNSSCTTGRRRACWSSVGRSPAMSTRG